MHYSHSGDKVARVHAQLEEVATLLSLSSGNPRMLDEAWLVYEATVSSLDDVDGGVALAEAREVARVVRAVLTYASFAASTAGRLAARSRAAA